MVERVRRSFAPILLIVILIAVLMWLVLPTSTWLGQRDAIAGAQVELEAIAGENAALQGRIDLLETDDEVERIARRDFNLIFPGEEAYAVLPAPPAAARVPDAWPFNVMKDVLAE